MPFASVENRNRGEETAALVEAPRITRHRDPRMLVRYYNPTATEKRDILNKA